MPYKNRQIQNLIELNDELENYFRNTIIQQLFVDADLILRKFTPTAMKEFSLSASDIGKPFIDVTHNFRFSTIIDNVQHVIDTNEVLEKELQTTDMRWYQMNIIPYVVQRDNKTNGVIITFVEITKRIKELKDQEKLNADHETLLDTISHDIKGPLANLIAIMDMIKDACARDDQKEFQSLLKLADASLSQMQNVITDLTEVRKQEHTYKAEEEILNFENILEDVRLIFNDNIIKSGTVIKSEIEVSEITYSRRKLRSIVYNLVNNAIKYKSPERKPEIYVKTKRDNGFIIISVKDNGIGIDASKFDAVFSKYYRIENSIEGSGIGLYLVKEMVTNSGGKILIESQLGKGTEFKVYLKAE